MLMFFMTIMMTMPSVSEQMHEETAKQEHKREIWRNVLAVVYYEIQTDDYKKADDHPASGLIIHTISFSALAYKF